MSINFIRKCVVFFKHFFKPVLDPLIMLLFQYRKYFQDFFITTYFLLSNQLYNNFFS